jgi:GAF domain-containing protein
MRTESNSQFNFLPQGSSHSSLDRVLGHLSHTLERDTLVQQTAHDLRAALQVDRVALYYFYSHWKGQVTFESLSSPDYSIYGSTGPDGCFNDEYAALYLAGRARAIANVEQEPIADCHREFLRQLSVQANLVVPILTAKGLWGLLAAHHCQSPKEWTATDIDRMISGAQTLATAPAIADD